MKKPDDVELIALQTLVNHDVERGGEFTATPEQARKLLRDGYAKKRDQKQTPAKSK